MTVIKFQSIFPDFCRVLHQSAKSVHLLYLFMIVVTFYVCIIVDIQCTQCPQFFITSQDISLDKWLKILLNIYFCYTVLVEKYRVSTTYQRTDIKSHTYQTFYIFSYLIQMCFNFLSHLATCICSHEYFQV